RIDQHGGGRRLRTGTKRFGKCADQLAQCRFHLWRGRGGPGDEEQRLGLGSGEAAQVRTPSAGETPTAIAALRRVDREAGRAQRIEVASSRSFGYFELERHLCRGDLPARLEQQQYCHESVSPHPPMISPKPVGR